MLELRQRLRLDCHTVERHTRESGLTLIEVVVAMMIFAMIATGALHATISTLSLTRDTRARQVATNLAAQEIDLARDSPDLFTLVDRTSDPIELNGDTFRVNRSTQWVSDPSLDLKCGAGGGALRYKRVNVTVTWDNMRTGTEPVRSDTVIDPKNRINDPTLGTILVSVLNASGTGSPGVSVTATPADPANGATSLTTTPATTDAQGCTYILKVRPGNYDVEISRFGTNSVGLDQSETPSETVGIVAGTATSVGFEYDSAGTFRVTSSPADALLANNLQTSFVSTTTTHRPYVWTRSGSGPNWDRDVDHNLHPLASGYHIIAGRYNPAGEISDGCLSVDPEAWTAPRRVLSELYVGKREPAVGTEPGGSVAATVPMGTATIKRDFTVHELTYIRAISADPTVDGDPGCGEKMTYLFGPVSTLAGAPDVSIALPYGSWTLYAGDFPGTNSRVPEDKIRVQEPHIVSPSGVVTMDPRIVNAGTAIISDGDGGDD